MANTRTAAKRARQAIRRQATNQVTRSKTRTLLKTAMDAIQGKDVALAKAAFENAIRALSKAASKGAMPKGRASRKISRLTRFTQKTAPATLS
jgi:small subunit ribosomal protein S20